MRTAVLRCKPRLQITVDMQKHSRLKNILRVSIPLTLSFIWGNSLLSGEQSGEMSGVVVRFIYPAAEKIAALLSGAGPGDKPVLSLEEVTFWVRKAAHFSEYAFLGIQAGLYGRVTDRKLMQVLPFGPLAAAVDETIQTHSAGRSGELRDVCIDSAGFIFGLCLVHAADFFIKRTKKRESLRLMKTDDRSQ